MKSDMKWTAMVLLLSTWLMTTQLFGQAQTFFIDSQGDEAWLGVQITDLNKTRASDRKLPDENGVLIDQVEKDSPAEKAGLQPKDVIVQFNGVRVFTVRQFSRMIRELLPERSITLGVVRDGTQKSFAVLLKGRPKPDIAWKGWNDSDSFPEIDIPLLRKNLDGMRERLREGVRGFSIFDSSNGRLGVTLEALSSQLGDYFGVRDGRGALVVSVRKDSPAEKSGIKAGDVIVGIGSREVASPSDVIAAVRERHEGPVEIKVVREHQPKTYTIHLEKHENEVGSYRRFPAGTKRHPNVAVRVL